MIKDHCNYLYYFTECLKSLTIYQLSINIIKLRDFDWVSVFIYWFLHICRDRKTSTLIFYFSANSQIKWTLNKHHKASNYYFIRDFLSPTNNKSKMKFLYSDRMIFVYQTKSKNKLWKSPKIRNSNKNCHFTERKWTNITWKVFFSRIKK